MKINEINQQARVNEGIGDALGSFASGLMGNTAGAGIKGLLSGKGKRHQLAQDLFLKDFTGDATTSLRNGLESGIIDATAQMSSTVPADGKKTDPTDTKLKGYSFSTTQTGSPAQPQQNVKVPPQNIKFNMPGRKPVAKESAYEKMNRIFESIIREQESEGTISIGDYMLEWFGLYMQGTNWQSYKPKIIQLCKNIEDAVQTKKNWKAAIQMLAKAAYTLSGPGRMPKGAENISVPKATSSSAPSDLEKTSDSYKNLSPQDQEKFKAAIAKT